MRRHIRHPTDLPIDLHLSNLGPRSRERLRNFGRGGLGFRSPVPFEPGHRIWVELPVAGSAPRTVAVVAWCREDGGRFEVGARFTGTDAEADRRLLECVNRIEDWRMEVWIREGRMMEGEEAAKEWPDGDRQAVESDP
jgi:hypothetical protein